MCGQSLATLYPAFGVNFKPRGMILPDLQRYDMLAIYELPRTTTILNTAEDWIIDNFCLENPNPDPFERDLCDTMRPMIQYLFDKTKRLKTSISNKLERDLIDILPDLSSNRGRRPLSQTQQNLNNFENVDEMRKTKEYLQAIETLEKTSKSISEQKRKQIKEVKENISKDKEFMDQVLREYMSQAQNETGKSRTRSKRSAQQPQGTISFNERFGSKQKYRQFRNKIQEKYPATSYTTQEVVETWENPEHIAISANPEGYHLQNCNGRVFAFRAIPKQDNWKGSFCLQLCQNIDKLILAECFEDCTREIQNETWTAVSTPVPTANFEFSQIVGMKPNDTQDNSTTDLPMCMKQSDIQLLLTHETGDVKIIKDMKDLATARNWTSPKQLGRALRLWPYISKIDPDLIYAVDIPEAQEVEQCRGTLLGRQVGMVDSECYSCATLKCLTALYLLHTYELRY